MSSHRDGGRGDGRVDRRQFLGAGGAVAAVAAVGASWGASVLGTVRRPKLLWAEEFNALDLVSPSNPHGRWRANDVWQPIDQGYPDFGSAGGAWMLNPNERLAGARRTPFAVRHSVLTITSRRTPPEWRPGIAAHGAGVPDWCGGILISNTDRADLTFGHGYYEVRARWPQSGRGMFPALWFYSAHGKNTSADKGHAEIDLLEIFGSASGRPWITTLHRKDNAGNGPDQHVHTGEHDTRQWHTYGLHWTAHSLSFYRDRVKLAEVTGPAATWFAGCRMSIRLGYAMNAAFFDRAHRSDGSTPGELTMQVDYVRRYSGLPAPLPF